MKFTSVLPNLSRDGNLVLAATTIRSLDYGFLSVFLGVYLDLLEFSALQAGLVFSGIMAGGALSNVVASWRGDTIGRRRMLVAMSVLMVIGGALFPFTTNAGFLVIIGLFAMTTATGGDRTAFVSLDTAILAQSTPSTRRTLVFTWYNLFGFFGKSVGALLVAAPPLIQSTSGVGELTSFKIMFGIYAIVATGGIVSYTMLSYRVEPVRRDSADKQRLSPESRSLILRLAALFSLDAMGGGFMVRSFISFWFVNRFGADLNTIAIIFFVGQMLNIVSVSMAAPIASRIGLINTMAFTQVFSNVMMMAMAFAGHLWLAIAFFFLKELSNDLDIPTRQAYTMAIVPPEDRTAMASVTNLGRNITQTISPAIAGAVAQAIFLGAPFIIGSGLKLIYNAMLYRQFSGVKPPEEADEREARSEGLQQQGEAGDD